MVSRRGNLFRRVVATAFTGAFFAVATFQDLLAHILRRGFDFLHFLADARSRGFVATRSLLHVVGGLFNQSLQRFIFRHSKPPVWTWFTLHLIPFPETAFSSE